MRDLTKHPCTEDLAIAAFEANERVKGLMIMNSPTDYEERKKAAVKLAVAREAAFYARQKLDAHLRGELPQDVVIAALVEAARLGLPADVQELLLHGDVMRGIPANILPKMLLAAVQRRAIMES